jgi:hypothetical protein
MTLCLENLNYCRASKCVMKVIWYHNWDCQVLATLQYMARNWHLHPQHQTQSISAGVNNNWQNLQSSSQSASRSFPPSWHEINKTLFSSTSCRVLQWKSWLCLQNPDTRFSGLTFQCCSILSVNWVCATPSKTFLLKWEHVDTQKPLSKIARLFCGLLVHLH